MANAALAEQTLQLLFKKLHPLLEDAAHALAKGAPGKDLERLHGKLARACDQASGLLDEWSREAEGELGDILGTLSANLTPVGGNFQQLLTLVQLCLEEAPAELLPHAPQGCVGGSAWGPRMVAFLGRLEDPAFQARVRWAGVDPEIGDEAREDED
jgi:hypothetical protein